MKIILLRHEERNIKDPRFFTPLTEKGRINSIKLINKLSKYKIDSIYCSPFERTIQTILPYCINQNKKLNIENSIYEYPNNDLFIGENLYHCKNIKEEYFPFINKNYNSFLNINDLTFEKNNIIVSGETIENIKKRCNNFLNKIIYENKNKNLTILMVSHESVLKMIEKCIYEQIYRKEHKYELIEMGEFREYNL